MTMPLPAIRDATRAQAALWWTSIAAAAIGFAVVTARLGTHADLLQWWSAFVFIAGVATADLASGLVHWGADTWGRDDLPFVGPRLLVPFRVHHINPDDFLRRSFVDTNGDVALLAVPLVAALLFVPLDTSWGVPATLFGLAFSSAGAMTNQIHQWAHMPSPPLPVRLLQDGGLILGRTAHSTHHARPYDAHYCITTGWWNRPLQAIGFFRGLERAITLLTGARPRHDDERYEERYHLA